MLCLYLRRAHETSKLYRDLKLRGSIVKDGELILLPQEQIFSKTNGRPIVCTVHRSCCFSRTWKQFLVNNF